MVRKHSSAVYHGGRARMLGSNPRNNRSMNDLSCHLRGLPDRTPPAPAGLLAGVAWLAMGRRLAPGHRRRRRRAAARSRRVRSGVRSSTGRPRRARPPRPWSARAAMTGVLHLPQAARAIKPKRRRPTPTTSASRSASAPRTAATPRSSRRRWAGSPAGTGETCFYVDVLPGTHHMLTFAAHEGRPTAGLSPDPPVSPNTGRRGPTGTTWSRSAAPAPSGRCTRDAADEWGAGGQEAQARAASIPAGRAWSPTSCGRPRAGPATATAASSAI